MHHRSCQSSGNVKLYLIIQIPNSTILWIFEPQRSHNRVTVNAGGSEDRVHEWQEGVSPPHSTTQKLQSGLAEEPRLSPFRIYVCVLPEEWLISPSLSPKQ